MNDDVRLSTRHDGEWRAQAAGLRCPKTSQISDFILYALQGFCTSFRNACTQRLKTPSHRIAGHVQALKNMQIQIDAQPTTGSSIGTS